MIKPSKLLRSQRGYLMIDLLIVMSLTALVLSMASIWVYKTLRYSTDVRQRDLHARNISRISRQLRTDIRDAQTISNKGNELVIRAGETDSISYNIDANQIHRKVTGGSQVHHDDFEFATNAKLSWKDQENNAVSLDISRDFSDRAPAKKAPTRGLDAQILLSVQEASNE